MTLWRDGTTLGPRDGSHAGKLQRHGEADATGDEAGIQHRAVDQGALITNESDRSYEIPLWCKRWME